MPLPADPGLVLTIYSPEPGTPSADAMALLATWATTYPGDTTPVATNDQVVHNHGEQSPPRRLEHGRPASSSPQDAPDLHDLPLSQSGETWRRNCWNPRRTM